MAGDSTSGIEGIVVRRAQPEDDARIIPLLGRTLGWHDDERHSALFHWKHRTNPFGSSPGWIAEDEHGLVGSRTFMRWQFEVAGEAVSAVRAVDTATDPRAQGRGIFRTLTMTGLDELRNAGVGWVFNTPNDKSAPGYLKMGWQVVGKLPVAIRPAGLRRSPRLISARAASDLWSLPTDAGEPADSVLQDVEGLRHLLVDAELGGPDGIRTPRTVEFLTWRYGECPVGYRALLAGSDISDGLLFFRLRRRGGAVEALVGDILVPGNRSAPVVRMCRRLLEMGEADYAIGVGVTRPRGWLPLPGIGPKLAWRPLAKGGAAPELHRWHLTAGDVELF